MVQMHAIGGQGTESSPIVVLDSDSEEEEEEEEEEEAEEGEEFLSDDNVSSEALHALHYLVGDLW